MVWLVNITLENISVYIGIIVFAGSLVNYMVMLPLRAEIKGLQEAIIRLEKTIFAVEKKNANHETRITRIEEAVVSAHKRVDRLEKICDGATVK